MRILVTGGSGLVGNGIRNIAHKYEPRYEFIFVSSKDYNLYHMSETEAMFKNYKPDYVIHLAANVGGLYKNMNQKVEMLEINLQINFNIVKCSHQYKIKKLIACLSTCIFPDKIEYPITEDKLHEGPPHHSNDAYAYAKRMLEIHCRSYREMYGSPFVCIIPTNIYGEHDNFDLENGHVLPSLIHKCFLAKKENLDFVVRGTGKPLRQFIYSKDLAECIMKVLEEYKGGSIILSPDEKDEVSIGEVARIIARCYDYEDRMIFDMTYSDGQYKKTVSNERLRQLYPEMKFTSLEEGIQETVKWFIENQNHI
jgi:GDP-L-fucose synthase